MYGMVGAPEYCWPVKGPEEYADYTYDASNEVGSDPVASASLATKPSGAGEITASRLTISGNAITVWLSNGVPGRRYIHRLIYTTVAGRTFEALISQTCDPVLALPPIVPPTSNGFGAVTTAESGAALPSRMNLAQPLSTSLIAAF